MADNMRLNDRAINGVDATGTDLSALDELKNVSPFQELGSTGLKRSGGYLDEEFLPQLRGRKAVQIFKEMSENDPLVGALIFTVDRLIRNVEWRVEPGGKTKEDADAAKLVETCMEDMSHTWNDFISEALSCLVYGWSWHEIVYKRRVSPWEKNPAKKSQFTDNMVGWRKMPIRAQETLLRWVFDESGDVIAMTQLAPPHYKTTVLPMDRSLLFRYRHHKGSPEGMSMLRNAYRPWYMKKRLEEFEAVGVERDLAGLPIVKVPAEFLRAKPGTAQAQTVEAFKRMVKSVRRDEQEGIVFPMAYDQDTKQPLYSFELMGGGGGRAFNTDGIIKRYEERILMTVLADFIMVGHQSTGSYSLHTDKTGIFRTSLNSIADAIADTLNRHAIPRLFLANGWKPANLPKIVPSDVDSPDISQLAGFMSSMAGMGVQWFPDPTLENFIRDAARLPKLDDEEESRLRQMQMRTDATRFAQANTEYIQAKQMFAQSMMGAQPQAPGQPGQPVQQEGQPGQPPQEQ
ncbi:hypothetical protein UFOVP1264_29 [uncultured Caudovirales phage]|uniref:Portal protein n=1 Tax=uncultured Caudovirales phage TaxID=2100421 RepID=A0A6J5RRU6_9CAUD|nr:hypothetical protein UFOVP1264_29 [uncultured Caudovirales phage]